MCYLISRQVKKEKEYKIRIIIYDRKRFMM